MLIDDAEVFREIMSELLEEKGCRVTVAGDGVQALEELRDNDFDLILLDLLLPRMTGFDLLKEIRKIERARTVPVLAVSGVYGKEEHLQSLKELGAAGFVSKEQSPELIAERILRTMEAGTSTVPAAPVPAKAPAPEKTTPEILKSMRMFRELVEPELQKIAAISRQRTFKPGQTIIKEGEEGDLFFGIISGTVLVEKKEVGGGQTVIARLGPGDEFGELALVDRDRRSATCTAEEEVKALEIKRAEFEQLLSLNPELERKCLKALIAILTERLRDTDASLAFARTLLSRVSGGEK